MSANENASSRGKKNCVCSPPARIATENSLRPIVICALDTGMRRGEIFGLKWSDVDFEERVLTIRAFNTKTMQERQVSLTTRLMIELERIWEESPKNKDFLVFGFTDNVKKSWTSVRTKAGLP